MVRVKKYVENDEFVTWCLKCIDQGQTDVDIFKTLLLTGEKKKDAKTMVKAFRIIQKQMKGGSRGLWRKKKQLPKE
jgi:hypothetical protein